MKKNIVLVLIFALMCMNIYAQRQSPEVRALQGTWVLIAGMNDQESFTEENLTAENLEVLYIFSGDTISVRRNNETIGPARFEVEPGYIRIIGETTYYLPYNLQGRILILHEGGYAFIYRRR